MEKNTTTNPLYLDIDDPQATPAADLPHSRDGIRFFGSRSFAANTWVVSLFVVLNLVAFAITMFVNNCPSNSTSHHSCFPKPLGRFSFQPISENPLLGPSSQTLARVGGLRRDLVVGHRQEWRILTCAWLHAGVVHLVLDLLCLVLVGIRLEQDYGPLRVGTIYLLSALLGSSISALFVRKVSSVGSSGGVFGLLGAMLSGLVLNWQVYDDKCIAVVALALIATTNLIVGLVPIVDNFANVGGFLAGVLLGCVVLFNPQLGQMDRKKGLYEYYLKNPLKWKQKLDRPVRRLTALLLFCIILAGVVVGVVVGVDGNMYCRWCRYLDCVPNMSWSCGRFG